MRGVWNNILIECGVPIKIDTLIKMCLNIKHRKSVLVNICHIILISKMA
jgi:hypothetical protein